MLFFFYLFLGASLSVAPRTVSVGLLLGNSLVPSSAGMSALGGPPGTHQGDAPVVLTVLKT